MTPPKFNPKFNQIFNQNSMSKHPATENFSCFPTIWEEGPTELADYSDEEEDNSLDNEDILSERDTWSEFDLEELGEISDKEDTWNKTEPDKFKFKTHSEIDYEGKGSKTTFTGISSISLETAQAFSAWQLYIPPEPVFRSLSAQSWWSDSSPLAFLSQEPTLAQISAIKGPNSTIGPTPVPEKRRNHPNAGQDVWKPSRPATKHYTHTWSKPWPELNTTYKETRSSLNESQDHPGQSKQSRPWNRQLQCSIETIRSQTTKFWNTPPETDTGNAPPVFIWCPSRIYLNLTSKPTTTKSGSLVTRWRRSSSKIQTQLMKCPRHIKHCQISSKRIPSWPWSPKLWPHTCLSNTTTEVKETPGLRISPRGGNHFSKRRSESENRYKNTKRKSGNKDIITLVTKSKTINIKRLQHKATAKADKVKAVKRTRRRTKRQLDQYRKYLELKPQISQSSFHLHFATTFLIFILIFIYLLFNRLDHHFRTFTFKNLWVCEKHYSLQTTALHWAKIAVTQCTDFLEILRPDMTYLIRIYTGTFPFQ